MMFKELQVYFLVPMKAPKENIGRERKWASDQKKKTTQI